MLTQNWSLGHYTIVRKFFLSVLSVKFSTLVSIIIDEISKLFHLILLMFISPYIIFTKFLIWLLLYFTHLFPHFSSCSHTISYFTIWIINSIFLLVIRTKEYVSREGSSWLDRFWSCWFFSLFFTF